MYIKETSDIKEFVDFQYRLLKKNPNFIGDLKSAAEFLLSDAHPFWETAEKKLFLAISNDQIVGRIAGILNHKYNEFQRENTAFFGFFDCINDTEVASLLFAAAEKWAVEKKCNKIVGPANPSSNYSFGLLVENFDEPNVIMMPYNPPYYIELIEGNGYVKEKDLYAFKWVYDKELFRRLAPVVERINKSNKSIRIETVDIKNLSKAFEDVKAVYNKAWENNWGFVPMTDGEIEQMAREIKPILKKEYVFFARDGEKPVAFCLMLGDMNIALKKLTGRITPFNVLPFLYNYFFKIKSGRLLALGVNKEYRGRGIEVMMILEAIKNAKKLGWDWGELSWTLEDNFKINKTIEKFGGKVYKKYRLYSKVI
ncbi:MAG: hypothetical protein KA059_03310 [Elusimicrobiales bacterium]|jgi:GNAT superfamily N-acetyltransferase|nr:hypothetical protein [Elusimicrobiales bacterium]NLH39138.1 hypothetical protein [Elusimicrobiota bacterium]